MFGELKKVLDRGFIIAYFTPALVLVGANVWLLRVFGLRPSWFTINLSEPLKDTTLIALITFAVALVLVALNRLVFRFLEGYVNIPWITQKLRSRQQAMLKGLNERIATLKKEKKEAIAQNAEFWKQKDLDDARKRKAKRFPSKESLVLPTAFGNTVRAYEDYSRVVYRYESITGWARLQGAMSKDYRELIGDAMSHTSLWVNLWFCSTLLVLEFLGLIICTWSFKAWPFPLACALGCWLATMQARNAAESSGEWIKAAFDLFLPELCKKLGYRRPTSLAEEQALWLSFSQAIVYRHAGSMEELDALRSEIKKEDPPAPEDSGKADASDLEGEDQDPVT
jgi:hypothetical protein